MQTERPPRGGLAKSGAFVPSQLLVCLCATFERADARLLLETALPDLGGLYLCLIRQPSKQNLAFNLYGRRELDLFSNSKTPRVEFRPKRIAEGDWQIEAHYPGAEIRYITGLTSKTDIDDWMAGSRKIAWLRSQGYAK